MKIYKLNTLINEIKILNATYEAALDYGIHDESLQSTKYQYDLTNTILDYLEELKEMKGVIVEYRPVHNDITDMVLGMEKMARITRRMATEDNNNDLFEDTTDDIHFLSRLGNKAFEFDQFMKGVNKDEL